MRKIQRPHKKCHQEPPLKTKMLQVLLRLQMDQSPPLNIAEITKSTPHMHELVCVFNKPYYHTKFEPDWIKNLLKYTTLIFHNCTMLL